MLLNYFSSIFFKNIGKLFDINFYNKNTLVNLKLVKDENINNSIFSTNLSMLSLSIYFIKVESQNEIKSLKLRVR